MKRSLTALLTIVLVLISTQSLAHRFAPSLLKLVEINPGEFNVVWKTPAQATSSVALQPIWPPACEVTNSVAPQLEGTGKVSGFTLDCSALGAASLVGQEIGVAALGANQASAMLMVELRDGRSYQQVVNAENSSYLIPEEPSAMTVVLEYSVLGAEHIWGGIDHLLFVFGLLLLVGWGRNLVWTITSFTVGHSITLSLVTLGFFDYPVALVEFAIALSIFLLALELARTDDGGLFRRYPWWLAGGFGLLHGMGFAGALADVGLPQSELPLALLFFNIGIEVGQLVFVFTVMAFWWLVRKPLRKQEGALLPIPVYVLGALSAMWCIERGLEVL